MLGGWWASKIFFTHKRGASSTFRLRFTLLSRTGVQSPWRFELRKAPKEAVDPGFVSFSPFQEACPDLFLSRALPAAGCDSKLSLGSGMQSSELSRQSLAYPGPTEINLAWSVRNPGEKGPFVVVGKTREWENPDPPVYRVPFQKPT